ncbi:hypothetical protein CC86DRAFT_197551 [Ophiobolus disseminans]|uniref:Methylated-DNA-[protein]-cysteine S-methyltransferase DNA binding domain-containing protein n=1 Tax=Ophiobolus disseminans TaxID=1469910 RepID=A0A6A7A825_9PLEO|nr:hypothetical protein CC86DRAFT_197551 [Ophiobolus disseminans]
MAPSERSEEVHLWYTMVYEAVQEVPRGKVTSYGHIARLLGKPERPRQVGVCLKHLPSPSNDPTKNSPVFHSGGGRGSVPWQRVVNSKGQISPREGVEVRQDAMGQYSIDLGTYGWFPDVLPSESGLVESSDEEDEEAAAYHT